MMNRIQKSTLRTLHLRIADELILDEDFYAALRRDKIFSNGMLEIIKDEGRPRERVYKMLELLEKRGPNAFEGFVWILKENFKWLADELEDKYRILQTSAKDYEREMQVCSHCETQLKTRYEQQLQHHSHDQTVVKRLLSTPDSTNTIVPTQQLQYASKLDQLEYVSTDDVNTITPQTRNLAQPNKKLYKDACISPIGIIESSMRSSHSSEVAQNEDSGNKSSKKAQNESDSGNNTPRKARNEIDSGNNSSKKAQNENDPGNNLCQEAQNENDSKEAKNENNFGNNQPKKANNKKDSGNNPFEKAQNELDSSNNLSKEDQNENDASYNQCISPIRRRESSFSNGNQCEEAHSDSRNSLCSEVCYERELCVSPTEVAHKEDSSNKTHKKAKNEVDSRKNVPEEAENDEDDHNEDLCNQDCGTEIASLTTIATASDETTSKSVNTIQVQSKCNDTVSSTANVVDGAENINYEMDDSDANFQPSETYYDLVRSRSRMSYYQEFSIPGYQDTAESELSFNQSEVLQLHYEGMKALSIKLDSIEIGDTDDQEFEDISWEMINDKTEKLINRLQNSDDMKMIRKCYNLFEERERQNPLNICIERLIAEMTELKNDLKEKEKQVDQMVSELYEQQQNISIIKKLRKYLQDKDTEIENLIKSKENLEKVVEEQNENIKGLEHRIRGDQAKRLGNTTKRRVPNTQSQSPRRQESRYALMQSAYVKPKTMTFRNIPGKKK